MKYALSVLKPYIREAAGNKQLSAGHEAGCEAAIHAIRKMFTDHDCEGLLLVDAENAFNELNRHTALRNIQYCVLDSPQFALTFIESLLNYIFLLIPFSRKKEPHKVTR